MGRSLKVASSVSDHTGLHESIFSWITPRLRQLPWRDTRDPWHVLVSEVMLQQTGVNRVLPKWQMFVDAFATPADCAGAPLGDVLRLWQGLGYPRRARNLQAAARGIVEQHDGLTPSTLDELLALPGIGPYTARAVLAFAFESDVAVVDTNIARVLARFHGRKLKLREAQQLADDWIPAGESWLWNQALMDLGATVCKPQPLCEGCPLLDRCSWRGIGDDPSVGSAGVSVAQARFEGSDRQARGRLIKQLGECAVPIHAVAEIMDRPLATAERLVVNLVDEGLVIRHNDELLLP
ncbi:MAG: A/G-specific adenine glycosylase [Actinomycetes bacterium]